MSPTVYPQPPMQQAQPQGGSPMGTGGMDPAILTAMLSDPRTPPGQRAAIAAALQARSPAARQQPQPAGAPAAQQSPAVNVGAALQQGVAMANGQPLRTSPMPQAPPPMLQQPQPSQMMARGGPVRMADGGDPMDYESAMDDEDPASSPYTAAGVGMVPHGGSGLGTVSPQLIELTKQYLAKIGDDKPTSEDKGLALAQAGFGMAASESPHFGVALGEGGLYGVKALQELKKERALQAMKQAAIAGTLGAAQGRMGVQQEAISQRRDAANQASLDRQETIAARRQTAADALASHNDAQAALIEQRFQANAAARDRNFYATGVWRDLPGDAEHGISGKPVPEERPALPQVMDPTTPPKITQALDQAHPQSYNALKSFFDDTDLAIKKIDKLEVHPGLESGTGTEGAILSHVPLISTDAKNFNIMKNSLVASLKLDALAQMRALSKNGSSGLGRVTNTEFQTVGEKIANLDSAQNTDQMRVALEDVRSAIQKASSNMRDAYVETYGEKYKGKLAPTLPWEKTEQPPASNTTETPNVPSDEDIKHTAKIHGISEDEVRRRLGILK